MMFTGDMGWAKTLPNLVDATVNDWIPSLDKILTNHASAKFVPGHGEVATASRDPRFQRLSRRFAEPSQERHRRRLDDRDRPGKN